jgi:hypothetical protein
MLTFIIWVMNLVRHQTELEHVCIHTAFSRHTLHVTETLSNNGARKFSTLLTIFTNKPMRNITLPIYQLGCLLNRSRNSHNNKHAVAGYTTKIARFRKDPMVHEQEHLYVT